MLNLTPTHDYLVGIDSDGCAFDTMELKHKECFIPNIINHWELQGVSKYAREAAEFVNLYSKSRGINRFPALVEAMEWLQRRPEVRARGVKIAIPQSLRDWMKRETKLGNPALEKAVRETGDPGLEQTLRWSKAVNESIEKMVRGVPPFPFVRQTLQKLCGKADVLVVSATPPATTKRRWPTRPSSSPSIRATRRRVGNAVTTRASSGSWPANSLARTKRNCWPSSTATCPSGRRGRWLIELSVVSRQLSVVSCQLSVNRTEN
jgi:hypothetical protein